MRQLLRSISRRLAPFPVIDGYDNPELIEVIFRKTVAYQPTAQLLDIGTASTVLDFGGACGIHYRQARNEVVRWAVVETESMVARARELASPNLRFFTSIEKACDWLGQVDLMHCDGALQYTPKPDRTVDALCAVGAMRMRWSRMFLRDVFTQETQTSLLFENGPGKLGVARKLVRYSRTSMSEADFVAAHHLYRIARRGADWFDFVRA